MKIDVYYKRIFSQDSSVQNLTETEKYKAFEDAWFTSVSEYNSSSEEQKDQALTQLKDWDVFLSTLLPNSFCTNARIEKAYQTLEKVRPEIFFEKGIQRLREVRKEIWNEI
jgi:hypothetical protein